MEPPARSAASAVQPRVAEPPQAFRPGLVLALVCAPIFIGALDLTIVSAVLPAVMSDLQIPVDTGLDEAAWVVSAYLLAYTVSMTFMGRVSDIWGRRRVYVISLLVFILGSVLVATAAGAPAGVAFRLARVLSGARPDRAFMALYALIFGRAVQAFGAGALVPISMALVGDLYPPERRATPLGVVGAVDTAGWVLGHLYGGIMVQHFAWPVLFWINVPLAGAALALTIWALRGVPQCRLDARLDWKGAALITLSLVALNLGLSSGVEASSTARREPAFSPALLIAALLALAVFLLVERRSHSPLIDLRAFRQRNFSTAVVVNLLVGFCLMAGLVSVPLYMNTVATVRHGIGLEQAALIAGYLLSAITVPMALAAILGGRLTGWLGYRWTTAAGAAGATVGFWLMSRWGVDASLPVIDLFTAGLAPASVIGIARMAAGLLLAGVGLGLTIAPIATAVINSVSASQRGVAAALVIIMRLVGMTLSISILTTFGLRRSQALRIAAVAALQLADLAAQIPRIISETTTQVVDEMAVIAGAVSVAALLAAIALRDRDARGTA